MIRRDWPEWDVDDRAVEQMAELFPAAIQRGIPTSANTGADVVTFENVLGRSRVTEILSGTTDKKSKAWKSAQRQQQRYRRGERGRTKLTPRIQEKLKQGAVREARARFARQDGPTDVSLVVKWTISSDTKRANPNARLADDYWRAFQGAVLRGNYVRAVQVVTEAYGVLADEVAALHAVMSVRIG